MGVYELIVLNSRQFRETWDPNEKRVTNSIQSIRVVEDLFFSNFLGVKLTLSAEPVAKINSLYGLNERQLTCKEKVTIISLSV